MAESGTRTVVDFRTEPSRHKHWRLAVDGRVATLSMDVREDGGLQPGYELKLNSYDLGVDIELYDAIQRLRFEHPEVGAVILTSAKERVFCAGANIRMLGKSSNGWKVYFCTLEEGVKGKRAVEWNLVDEVVPRTKLEETVKRRAAELAARSDRPADARGITLTPLERTIDGDRIAYRWVACAIDRSRGVA